MPTLSVCGIDLYTVDRGAGAPLLFVHGFPLDHTMWSAQLDEFRSDHRVLAPDLRGFGRSSVTSGSVTMEQFADDLAALLDAAGVEEPVVVCGLSMGGYVALAFARAYRSRLRGLVLCDTRAQPDTPDGAAARHETATEVLQSGPATLARAMTLKLFAARARSTRPDLVERVREVIEVAHPEGIAAALRGMAAREDSTPLLPTLDLPVLVAVGSEDSLSPPGEMRSLAAALPEGRFVEIPEAGHLAPLENPVGFNAALRDWLGVLPAEQSA